MDDIKRIEENIKNLTIQGATNVANAVLEGIEIACSQYINSLGENIQPVAYIKKTAQRLAYARPTEPLAQNALRFIFDQEDQSLDYYIQKTADYRMLIKSAKDKMGKYGIDLIKNGGVYLTHCHSSTVVGMFIKAKNLGRRFSVFATETRPMFQGRSTVTELLHAGIEDVTLMIDDAAISLMEGRIKHIDGVFIGADLLGEDGLVNKVGSLGIVKAAQRKGILLYSTTILLKYDPRPFDYSLIEHRKGEEIWPLAPKGIHFYAPAFDYIPYDTGIQIVSEAGIVKGKEIKKITHSLYDFLKEE